MFITETDNFVFDTELIANLMPVLRRFEEKILLQVIVWNDSNLSQRVRNFVKGFVALSDKVVAEYLDLRQIPDADDKYENGLYPAIRVFDGHGIYTGISFHGLPTGHEFNSFVLALYNVAGPGENIDDATIAKIKQLPPHNLKIAVSLSCQVCPETVQSAQLIACHHPGIQAEMIDLAEFSDLREKYTILSVPAVIVDHKHFYFGRKTLHEMIELLKSES